MISQCRYDKACSTTARSPAPPILLRLQPIRGRRELPLSPFSFGRVGPGYEHPKSRLAVADVVRGIPGGVGD